MNDLVKSEGEREGEIIFLQSSATGVVHSTQEKAALALVRVNCKEALERKDYKRVFDIFMTNALGNSDSLKNTFVTWLLFELEKIESQLQQNWETDELYDAKKAKEEKMKEQRKSIISVLGHTDFFQLLSVLSLQNTQNLLDVYLNSNVEGNIYYSHTQALEQCINNADISQIDSDRVMRTLIKVQADAAMHHATSPMVLVPHHIIDGEMRILESRIILRSIIGKSFDIQKAALASTQPFSYFLHFLIQNYHEQVNWDEVITVAEKMIELDTSEKSPFGYNFSQGEMGKEVLKLLAEGQDKQRFTV